jgi:hypothetical protein
VTTQLDASIGIKVETTYGTPVTVDQFLEFTDEGFDRKAEFVQGEGLRVGSRVDRAARRSLGAEGAEGSLTIEAPIKGLGILLKAALGAVTNTAVPSATGAYQQVHTPATTDPVDSYTIQKGIPPIGGGTTTAITFPGCVCSSIEFSAKAGEIVEVATDWIGREVKTDVAYATPSYPSYPAGVDPLFTFVHGAIVLGGTVTAPTNTALATGGTTAANITEFSLKFEQGLDDGARGLGGAGKITRKPVLGKAKITGSLEAEYDSTTLRDAYLAQTRLALVLTFTHDSQIGTGTPVNPVLQIVVPVIVLEGEIPKAGKGDPMVLSLDFTGLDGLSGSPIYVVYRTTDTTP